jgi:hypothetical protein
MGFFFALKLFATQITCMVICDGDAKMIIHSFIHSFTRLSKWLIVILVVQMHMKNK